MVDPPNAGDVSGAVAGRAGLAGVLRAGAGTGGAAPNGGWADKASVCGRAGAGVRAVRAEWEVHLPAPGPWCRKAAQGPVGKAVPGAAAEAAAVAEEMAIGGDAADPGADVKAA